VGVDDFGGSIAEQYWHAESKRRDGKPPEIRPATAREIQKLLEAKRKHPDHVARRVVLTFDGKPIWCYAHLGKISWFKVTWEQDLALDARLR
jgi:hypothetical protein